MVDRTIKSVDEKNDFSYPTLPLTQKTMIFLDFHVKSHIRDKPIKADKDGTPITVSLNGESRFKVRHEQKSLWRRKIETARHGQKSKIEIIQIGEENICR